MFVVIAIFLRAYLSENFQIANNGKISQKNITVNVCQNTLLIIKFNVRFSKIPSRFSLIFKDKWLKKMSKLCSFYKIDNVGKLIENKKYLRLKGILKVSSIV